MECRNWLCAARIVVFALGIFFVAALACRPTHGDEQVADVPKEIVIKVVEESGNPIPQAKVRVRNDKTSRSIVANTDGEVRLPRSFTDGKDYFSVSVNHPNYVPLSRAWIAQRRQSVPDHITARMPKGTKIGGRVCDEEAQAIPGANVLVTVYTTYREADLLDEFTPNIHDQSIPTDDEGRWECNIIPAGEPNISIRLDHPEYLSGRQASAGTPPLEELRAGTAKLVMKKGNPLFGTVTDDEGNPIQGATVAMGTDRFGSGLPKTTTDINGAYRFSHCVAGPTALTVVAKGWLPDLRQIRVLPDTGPVDFKLAKGKTIRVRVVDLEGQPVEGAEIVPDTWRGCRTLFNLGIARSANKEGIWEWDYAPADVVLCDILKRGYMDVRGMSLVARDEEYVITLHKPLIVSGRVLDAATKDPIEAFRVIKGIAFSNSDQRISWDRRDTAKGTDGKYEIEFTYPYHAHLVRIEADGYLPADSRRIKSDEGAASFDFLLEKGEGIAGVVRLPNGQPAVGAAVGLATRATGLYVSGGRNQGNDSAPWTKTDSRGRFSFPALPPSEAFELLALHDGGVRRISGKGISGQAQVDLQPWARVEGNLMLGSRPGANEEMWLSPSVSEPYDETRPRVSWQYSAKTDAEGKYRFDRVTPGEARLGRMITYGVREGGRMSTSTHNELIHTTAGETAHVDIGGDGRAVVGRLTLPADAGSVDWNFALVQVMLKQPEIPWPKDIKVSDQKARGEWHRQWLESPEGKQYQETLQRRLGRNYAAAVAADGTFRLEDVSPEEYQLLAQVNEPTPPNQCGFGEPIGSASQAFTMPEITPSSVNEPLDLGDLPIQMFRRLKVGDLAPDFEVKGLDGKSLRLSDLRGKYVLVDFWATWCGPCVAETPHLLVVKERFGANERFAMVGLSCDTSEDSLRSFVGEKKIDWPQAMLGSGSQVASDYGVRGIPSIYLIDPEGKIAAKGLRGEAIAQELERVLK